MQFMGSTRLDRVLYIQSHSPLDPRGSRSWGSQHGNVNQIYSHLIWKLIVVVWSQEFLKGSSFLLVNSCLSRPTQLELMLLNPVYTRTSKISKY